MWCVGATLPTHSDNGRGKIPPLFCARAKSGAVINGGAVAPPIFRGGLGAIFTTDLDMVAAQKKKFRFLCVGHGRVGYNNVRQ